MTKRDFPAGLPLVAAAFVAITSPALARDEIRIVGSSTVFPFSATVAETFGRDTSFPTPVVESTGTGGGMKLFCTGVGPDQPDIANASRRIKSSEFEACAANGVSITELKIGHDGIVLANARSAPPMALSSRQIFMALARELPVDGKLVANPHKLWRDIDPALPAMRIEVLGPPPTSGTRDAFVELAMESGCEALEGAAALGLGGKACHQIREDGAYIEAGENDNLIVRKLEANPEAVGIFGYSFLDNNLDKLQGITVDGVEPAFDAIADGEYTLARLLYIYVKREHAGVIPGLAEYIVAFTSEAAMGDEGYLTDKGLIPLPAPDRDQMARDAAALTALSL